MAQRRAWNAGRKTARKGGRPVCVATGKIRYRDGHDAALALTSLRKRRSRVEAEGGSHRIRVQRKYACPACDGWHLTSQPQVLSESA